MQKFQNLGITSHLLKAIEEARFQEPSSIQEQTIPLALKGKDIIAGSATGSGKTLAFGAAIIQNNHPGQGIQSLVLTPTRELAEQVSRELSKFSHYFAMRVLPIYGGVSINPQIEKLPLADVVVGTPGRILDHLRRGTINLTKLKILVLDEADRMLDMGFIDDVDAIVKQLPAKRQTLLFSATISKDIEHLARKYLHDPVRVSVESFVDPAKLKQIYYDVPDGRKFTLLVYLLRNEKSGLVMVFCNTQRSTDYVTNRLREAGIKAIAIHGGLSQNRRTKTLERFHSKDFHVLVCTDIAARGLDIQGVTHVYNYNAPKESKQYIHRIGRTARAGKEGIAISLISDKDHDNFRRVLRENSIKVPKLELPSLDNVITRRNEVPRKPIHKFDKNKAMKERQSKFDGEKRFGEVPSFVKDRGKFRKKRRDNAANPRPVRRGWA